MGKITQNVIALRIARRSVRRNRLQSFLIIAIIALPMALAGFALTYVESTRPTGPELVKYQLGLAQARFLATTPPNEKLYQQPTGNSLSWDGEIVQGTDQTLVAVENYVKNRKLIQISNGVAEFNTAAGVGSLQVVVGDSWNTKFLGQGPVALIKGHVPSKPTEVLVSPDALERFGVNLGGVITTTDKQSFKVVGILSEASRGSHEDVVYFRTLAVTAYTPAETYYFQLSGTAPKWREIQKLNEKGIVVVSRAVLLNPPPASEVRGEDVASSIGRFIALVFLVPLILLPVIVLAGSAFAFGARRQTRTLAVLSSLGASKKTLRNVTLASGVWLGLIGGLVGLFLGVGFVLIFGSTLAELNSGGKTWLNYPGFHLPLPWLLVALLASVALGAITSLVPAMRASKVNVLATLRGSRAEGQVRVRAGVGALVMFALGAGSILASLLTLLRAKESGADFQLRQLLSLIGVFLGLGGAIVLVIAFMVGAGWILRAMRWVMAKFGSTSNFAGKDLLYNRRRYSPVIASVLTVTFVATFGASFAYGPTKAQRDFYQYRYLPGQAGIEFGVKPVGFDPSQSTMEVSSFADFWAGVPKRETLESERKLVMASGSFDSATIVDSTIDVLSSMGTIDADGTIASQFDVPTPVVLFNPASVCYYTGLATNSQEWLQAHGAGMTQSDMRLPAGCVPLEDPKRTIVVGGADALRAITKEHNSSAEETLKNGGVVLFNKGYDYEGKAKISWLKPSDYYWAGHNLGNANKTVELSSYLVSKIQSKSFAYSAMISPETAIKLGIKAYPTSIVVNYTGDISAATMDKLDGRNIYLNLSNGTGLVNPETLAWTIVLLAALFSLASTGIALGLSQIEARTDKRTLSAIGAPRSFRARLVASQSFALTLVGSLLGGLTGLMLGAAMLNSVDESVANFPWLQLTSLVLGLPVVAALVFLLFTPRSLKYEARQALD